MTAIFITRSSSPFHADDLLKGMDDLDKVRLVRHYLVDRLVGRRDLVDDAFVLAADDTARLLFQIFQIEFLVGGIPAHEAAGTVRAGVEALRRALAAHDIAASAHAAGDDAELARAGADRSLAREPDRFAVVLFALDVIVVAVDRRARYFERRQMAAHGVQNQLHHFLAVGARVVLRPADRLDVVVEVLRVLREVGEVRVGQANIVPLRILLRQLDEVGPDRVADAAAAGVQHRPHAIRLIEADLDEMVAAAQRAELVRPARVAPDPLPDPSMLVKYLSQPLLELLSCAGTRIAVAVLAEAHRHVPADLGKDLLQRAFIEFVAGEREPRRHHATADVDADRGRNDGPLGRNHRADGGANTEVNVRHRRHVMMHERQARNIDELGARLRFDLP